VCWEAVRLLTNVAMLGPDPNVLPLLLTISSSCMNPTGGAQRNRHIAQCDCLPSYGLVIVSIIS
jgi:hypothetical protein